MHTCNTNEGVFKFLCVKINRKLLLKIIGICCVVLTTFTVIFNGAQNIISFFFFQLPLSNIKSYFVFKYFKKIKCHLHQTSSINTSDFPVFAFESMYSLRILSIQQAESDQYNLLHDELFHLVNLCDHNLQIG